jgi:hypothetical protein
VTFKKFNFVQLIVFFKLIVIIHLFPWWLLKIPLLLISVKLHAKYDIQNIMAFLRYFQMSPLYLAGHFANHQFPNVWLSDTTSLDIKK